MEVADFATMLPMWEAWPVNMTEIGWLCMVVDSKRAAATQNDQTNL